MKIRPLHDRIVVRRTEEEQNFYFFCLKFITQTPLS